MRKVLAGLALGTLVPLLVAVPASAASARAEVSPAPAQTIDNIGASGAWWVNGVDQHREELWWDAVERHRARRVPR
jgi:hypothetical protein